MTLRLRCFGEIRFEKRLNIPLNKFNSSSESGTSRFGSTNHKHILLDMLHINMCLFHVGVGSVFRHPSRGSKETSFSKNRLPNSTRRLVRFAFRCRGLLSAQPVKRARTTIRQLGRVHKNIKTHQILGSLTRGYGFPVLLKVVDTEEISFFSALKRSIGFG